MLSQETRKGRFDGRGPQEANGDLFRFTEVEGSSNEPGEAESRKAG